MSRLQEKARPQVTRVLAGGGHALNRVECTNLAAWVAMTTMMIDQADQPTVGISEADRLALKEDGLPPPEWRIFYGVVREGSIDPWHGGDPRGFWHRSISFLADDEDPQTVTRAPDAQLTMFRIGGAAFVATSSDSPDNPASELGLHRLPALRQIWPTKFGGIRRPSVPFDQDAADLVVGVFTPAERVPDELLARLGIVPAEGEE